MFAGACALILAWNVYVALWLAVTYVDTTAARVWAIATAAATVALVAIAVTLILRRPNAGRYFLIGLVCLAASVLCFFGWAQVVVWY